MELLSLVLCIHGRSHCIRGALQATCLRIREYLPAFVDNKKCLNSKCFFEVPCFIKYIPPFLIFQPSFQRGASRFFKENQLGNYFVTYFFNFY